MAKWTFEPGHTAAEFVARHMMVTLVRGSIQDVHGTLQYDADNPTGTSVSVEMDASKLWSGDEDHDGHLKAADFLDVENHPTITFTGDQVEVLGANDFIVTGDLTIRSDASGASPCALSGGVGYALVGRR
jgi:polyisoprenoid-binding protein YceI